MLRLRQIEQNGQQGQQHSGVSHSKREPFVGKYLPIKQSILKTSQSAIGKDSRTQSPRAVKKPLRWRNKAEPHTSQNYFVVQVGRTIWGGKLFVEGSCLQGGGSLLTRGRHSSSWASGRLQGCQLLGHLGPRSDRAQDIPCE